MSRNQAIRLLAVMTLAWACGSVVPGTGTAAAPDGLDTASAGDGMTTTTGAGTSPTSPAGGPPISGGSSASTPGSATGNGSGSTGSGEGRGSGGSGGSAATAADAAEASGPQTSGPAGSDDAAAPGEIPTQPPTAPGQTGRGFDETTINLGVAKAAESGDSDAITGMGIDIGTTTIDYEAALSAVVDDINARGGIAGRAINVVRHEVNTGESLFSPATAAQSACATWTEDNQVFAVVNAGLAFLDDLVACLDQHDTPLIDAGGIQGYGRSYQGYYDTYPLYYPIGSMEGGRYDRIAIRRLVERGFFEPWDTTVGAPTTDETLYPMKLAINVLDSERGEESLASYTAELARYGIEVSSVFRQSDQVANAASDSQAAVLRWRAEGITHVFGSGLFHHTTAEQQGYRPRYFLEHDGLNAVALSSPAAQLRGSVSESLVPASATSEQSYPGHPEAYLPCLAVLEAAGVEPSTNLDHWTMQILCDDFYPLRDAIAASGVLSNDGMSEGFTALGSRPVSAVTWTSQFTPTQRASAMAVRDLSFVEDCTCYAYDSDINHSE